MKNFYFIFFFLFSINIFGQSVEEKAAMAACECIKKIETLTDAKYRDCLSISLVEAHRNSQNISEFDFTVEDIQSAFRKVDSITKSMCESTFNTVERKKEKYYSNSKNENAFNSYLIGNDLMNEGKYDFAIKAFNTSLKHDKNSVVALDNIAICYRRLDKFDKAIKYYKKSLAIFPEGDVALVNIGVIYTQKTEYKISCYYYKKLIEYYPSNPEGYFGFAKNLTLLNDYENALVNVIKAHFLYAEEESEYIIDSETLINIIYSAMEKNNKANDFIRIASENGLEISVE